MRHLIAARWVCVATAAQILGMTPEALRRAIERRARRADDGTIVATLDGVHARKLGRLWRIALDEAWTNGAASTG